MHDELPPPLPALEPAQSPVVFVPPETPLPSVPIFRDAFAVGLERIEEWDQAQQSVDAAPLNEALNFIWRDWDAHFLSYSYVPAQSEDPLRARHHPRFKKCSLPDVRARGADLRCVALTFDWDSPGHLPWTEDTLAERTRFLEQLWAQGWWFATGWTAYYRTAKGLRFIFVLAQSISVEMVEPYMRSIVRECHLRGVAVDALHDWTRYMRLPYVLRAHKRERFDDPPKPPTRTWEVAGPQSIELVIRPEYRLDVSLLQPVGEPRSIRSMVPLAGVGPVGEPPTPYEAREMVSSADVGGKQRLTEFGQLARKRLKNYDAWYCITGDQPLRESHRNNDLVKFIGQAVTLLHRVAPPQQIYALFVPVLEQLKADSQNPDWLQFGWRHVCEYWTRAEAQRLAEDRETASVKMEVLAGMREWCKHSALYRDEASALAFVEEHLLCCQRSAVYVMNRQGRYDGMPVGDKRIVARVRELGMDLLIKTHADENGIRKEVPLQRLLDLHATNVREVAGLVGDPGGRIERIGDEEATLVVKSYSRREDLEPEYDADVDEFMRLLGGDDAAQMCRWFGKALAFEQGPICALALVGAPSSGKQMVVSALGECITSGTVVHAKEVFARFAAGLLRTPFVCVNEAWPKGQDPADLFRELTGGDPLRIEEKYGAIVTFRNPLRLILTANNMGVVEQLVGRRDITQHDREALAMRLLVVKVDDRAAKWLEVRGGPAFTRGWIQGTDGSPSRHVLARHLMWLYAKHKNEAGDRRFLVQGGFQPDVAIVLRTRSGAAPLVLETLVKMIETGVAGKLPKHVAQGMIVDRATSKVWVLAGAVLDSYRSDPIQMGGRKDVDAVRIGSTLTGLSLCAPRVFRHEMRPEVGPQCWHQLDLALLLESARKDGRPTPMLAQLVEGAQVLPMPKAQVVWPPLVGEFGAGT